MSLAAEHAERFAREKAAKAERRAVAALAARKAKTAERIAAQQAERYRWHPDPNERRIGAAKREAILRDRGFSSYSDYLASRLWMTIRWRVMLAADKRCQFCRQRAARQVHHKFYTVNNLMGTNVDGLVAVCARCHKKAHGIR